MKQRRFTIRALILTAAVTLALTLGVTALALWLRLGPGGLAVLQSMELIRSRFPGEYDGAQTAPDAIQGMVDGLDDRWSFYLTAQEYQQWQDQQENIYIGLGLTYTPSEDQTAMEIVELIPGGPAERAGLAVGDRITAIDGQALSAENFSALVDTIGGTEPRDMVFTVQGPDGAVREVTARLDRVERAPVEWGLTDSGVGYVRLSNFYQGSAAAAEEAVEALRQEGARALLFDVRYNPGGYADELVKLLDYLLPQGPVFAERAKNGPTRVFQSDAACVELPMAVLVNAESYSAAEMFAAQLRESVGATLVGERTVGKGFYQQTFRLLDGSALNLSTGFYTTGGGESLIGKGIEPDIQETDLTAQVEEGIRCLEEALA